MTQMTIAEISWLQRVGQIIGDSAYEKFLGFLFSFFKAKNCNLK